MGYIFLISIITNLIGCLLVKKNTGIYLIYISFLFLLVGLYLAVDISTYKILEFKITGYSIILKLDDYISKIFILLLAILWPLAIKYSYYYFLKDTRLALILFTISSSIILAGLTSIAGNLFTMFISYEFLSFSTLPLIAISKSPQKKNALQNYFLILSGSASCLLLPAIIIISNIAQTDIFSDFFSYNIILSKLEPYQALPLLLMFLYGLSKSALWPLHSWLIKAMIADYPVSALLHAVAVVKIGIICTAKVCYYIFGKELSSIISTYPWILYLPIFSMLYAAINALIQTKIKHILAYATMSKLSFLILVTLISSKEALISNLVSHAIAKITLFFAFGYLYMHYGVTDIKSISGLYKKNKMLFFILTIAALSLSDIPFLPGYLSKYIFIKNSNATNIVLLIINIGSIITVAYTTKILWHIYKPSNATAESIEIKQNVLLFCLLTLIAIIPILCFQINSVELNVVKQIIIILIGIMLYILYNSIYKKFCPVKSNLNIKLPLSTVSICIERKIANIMNVEFVISMGVILICLLISIT